MVQHAWNVARSPQHKIALEYCGAPLGEGDLWETRALLLLLLLLARVTYNQVQPLRINYLATKFLELYS